MNAPDSRVPMTAVLKFGGEIVADTPRLAAVVADVAELTRRGWRLLLCHGGSPQANALIDRLGIEKKQIGGRRVTDRATLEVMKYVLAGQCNVDVVAAAAAHRIAAVGISGVSAGTVTAIRRPPKVFSGCGPDPVDFGWVGQIRRIRPGLIQHLWQGGYTPVLNTLGISERPAEGQRTCQVFNINADTVAAALAAELKADHLFLMTGVPGVLRDVKDPASRIERMTAAEARRAIADQVIVGGMIPKIEEAIRHLGRGVGQIHILGADAGSLLAEARRPGSRGTVLSLE